MSDDSLLEFPCEYPLKVLGRNDQPFRTVIDALVAAEPETISVQHRRASRSGHFLSISLLVQADSREQLDRIYEHLTASEAVLVAL